MPEFLLQGQKVFETDVVAPLNQHSNSSTSVQSLMICVILKHMSRAFTGPNCVSGLLESLLNNNQSCIFTYYLIIYLFISLYHLTLVVYIHSLGSTCWIHSSLRPFVVNPFCLSLLLCIPLSFRVLIRILERKAESDDGVEEKQESH